MWHTQERSETYRFWTEKPEGKRPSEELGIEGKVVHTIISLKEVEHEGVNGPGQELALGSCE